MAENVQPELKRFKLSPNPEADTLEEMLGIAFTTRPARIEWTHRNRAAYIGTAKTVYSGIYRAIEIIKTRGNPSPFFDHHLNAFFCRRGKPPNSYTFFHENMHGFSHQSNLELHQSTDMFSSALKEFIYHGTLPPVDMERYLTYRCLNEGVAIWGAVETQLRLAERDGDNNMRREAVGRYNLLIAGWEEYQRMVGVNFPLINEQERRLRQSLGMFQLAFDLPPKLAGELILKALKHQAVAKDRLGYYFTHITMEKLRLSSPLTTAQDLGIIIQNPPQTLAELLSPLEFADRVTRW